MPQVVIGSSASCCPLCLPGGLALVEGSKAALRELGNTFSAAGGGDFMAVVGSKKPTSPLCRPGTRASWPQHDTIIRKIRIRHR
jgi:hypothetical protein